MSDTRLLDDRYELTELVGSGGMAEVWRARDTRLGRDVAVKLLSGPSANDASMRRRIEREARALAALSHPNIVAVYDYGEAESPSGNVRPYVVMELVDGVDLERHLQAEGPLPVDEALGLLRAVLSAVDRAHAAGIVHGDLKPANVLLSSRGPKVGDFGVARILAEETGTTTVAATPTFAAPEVLRGGRPTESSDIYSAACLAFQMLTGRPPYEGANAWEVASKHMEDPVPLVRHLRSDIPGELEEVIRRGMEKNPKRRHRSVAAFSAGLGDSPQSTVPVATAAAVARPDATEVLPDRPDLSEVALLGPLADWGGRIGARLRKAWPNLRASPRVLLFALIAFLAVLALVLFNIDRGPQPVAVPDVRGQRSAAAVSTLRTSGFTTDVSYRPVTEGEPDIVLETIPAHGQMIEPGTEIHVIASALARTPEPPAPVEEQRGDGEKGRGETNGGKDRDKDDD